ncbi:hypothetical protein AAFF_G00140730 [Aldrovandia affinis]|uniref:Uncharacterized protein n=1 Tax=Aldrovandia affinis TaxID=143900 RepID=A0AAD7X422_9TELE|nr:hypothetical protein AAFF_G00140730 [Aldrovandia affinis]
MTSRATAALAEATMGVRLCRRCHARCLAGVRGPQLLLGVTGWTARVITTREEPRDAINRPEKVCPKPIETGSKGPPENRRGEFEFASARQRGAPRSM